MKSWKVIAPSVSMRRRSSSTSAAFSVAGSTSSWAETAMAVSSYRTLLERSKVYHGSGGGEDHREVGHGPSVPQLHQRPLDRAQEQRLVRTREPRDQRGDRS